MKFKKAFAVILAVAMVITLMPTMAFAATNNSVSPDNIKVAAEAQVPALKLNLELKGNVDPSTSFKLTLDNAEWAGTSSTATTFMTDYASDWDDTFNDGGESIQIGKMDASGKVASISNSPSASDITKDSVKITFNATTNLVKGETIVLYLNLKAGSESGDVSVNINALDSVVSTQTIKVAEVVEGATTASVVDDDDITTVANDGVYTGNQIKIEENYIKALGATEQKIKLILPKDYSWSANAKNKYQGTISSDLVSGGTMTGSVDSEKKNELTITFTPNQTGKYARTITITPKFRVSPDADAGDVTVDIENIEGDISEASDLVIAENVVEAVEVTTFDELTTVQSGLMLENDSAKLHYVYVQLKENVKDALEAGRTVLFDFPEEVQVLNGVGYTDNSKAKRTSGYDYTVGLDIPTTATEDASEFEWVVNKSYVTNNAKDTITFKVPVSVEAGFTGDIDVTVSGAKAGVEEQTVTVGTAVNPLTVEAATNDVKTGIQNQTVSAITLKETAAGMLQDTSDNNTVELYIYGCDGLDVNKADIKAEVTEGDIEISAPKVSGNKISFTVKDSSRKEASTIVISGFTVSLNRVDAEGGYDLRVAGNAVVDNTNYNNKNFQGYSVAAEKYLNVITPADSDIIANKVDATFVVGESQYTNNGVTVAMDVASFIQNNRTYVPVRFLANALGVTDENIAWNEGARTVTLTGANTVVKLTVGSNVITTSTGTVTADVPVIVKDNRTYLPARFVANAFGADVAWDGTTRTVTITR